MKLYPDFDGNSRVVGQLSKLILSKALRSRVRRQTSQSPSVKAIPTRTYTDIQSHTVMQMKRLWCLVLQCCISKFAALKHQTSTLSQQRNCRGYVISKPLRDLV